MDRMYGSYHPAEDFSDEALMSPENYPIFLPSDYPNYLLSSPADRVIPIFGSPDELLSSAGASSSVASITPTPPPPQPPPSEDNYNYSYYQAEDNNNNNNNSYYNDNNNNRDDENSLIKAKIASHPSYPRLVDAYISCQKVGASPEVAGLLEEIGRENDASKREYSSSGVTCYGADPELDEFMKTYCDVLVKYKTDLERPFDEATDFLNKTQVQLRNLCTGASIRSPTDEGALSSDEELSGGEVDANNNQPSSEEHDLKDKLLRRFGSHISTLKLEFSKKKKKGKLPKEARQTLLEWWNVHYKWPYPTEVDKMALAESTGLEQKQINNWFINQRKRHWKPSENMQFAVMNSLSGQFLDD